MESLGLVPLDLQRYLEYRALESVEYDQINTIEKLRIFLERHSEFRLRGSFGEPNDDGLICLTEILVVSFDGEDVHYKMEGVNENFSLAFELFIQKLDNYHMF